MKLSSERSYVIEDNPTLTIIWKCNKESYRAMCRKRISI